MYNNLIVIVLARGNSKRLKNKNLQKFGGKTLVELAIEIPVSLGLTTIVSSENRKIIGLAKKNGAMQHVRSKELSKDETSSEEVILQILQETNISNKNEILLLQPTSPLRQKKQLLDFLKTWDAMKIKDKIDQAISVTRESGDFWVYRKNKPERVRDLISDVSKMICRNSQLRESFYRENGLYYISKISVLGRTKSLISGKLGLIETDKITAIDIDDQYDLEIAQLIHKKYEK
jgi:CMP-N-acetylneuraminic acid synthetase